MHGRRDPADAEPDVHAVHERAGEPGQVAPASLGRARAVGTRDAVRTARAPVPRHHQLEAPREVGDAVGPVDADDARFERLPQAVQHGARELRRLVEAQHSPAGAHGRPRADAPAAASDDPRGARRVVRRLQGWTHGQLGSQPLPAERPDAADLQRGLLVEVGQEAGEPLGEHRLPRAGRAEQEHVVPARGRDHERLHGLLVADHVAQAGLRRLRAPDRPRRSAPRGRGRTGVGLLRLRLELGAVVDRRIPQPRHGDDPHVGHEGRLVRVAARHHDPAGARSTRGEHRGQDAVRRTQPPVEAELAEVHGAGHRLGRHRPTRREDREGYREVEAGAVLRQDGRREVDGDPADGELASRVACRGADPLAGLAERGVRQADEHEPGELARDVGLDVDERSVQAGERDGERATDGHQQALRTTSTDGCPPRGQSTPTTSIRTGPRRSGCAWHQRPARTRRREAFARVTASSGCP